MAVNLSLVLHTLYKTLRQNTCCPTFLRAKALQGHETVGETHHHPPDTNLLLSVARSPSFAQLSSKSWLTCAAQGFQTSLEPLPSSLLDSRRGLLEALHKQSRRLVSKL